MRFSKFIIFMLLFNVLPTLVSCTSERSLNQQQTTQQVITEYGPIARASLRPYFQKAHVNYPGNEIAILVFKHRKILEIYAKQEGHWHYIKSYPVLAASGVMGPKLKEGDLQVPEGIYNVIALNPNSHFNLSMELNYPNEFDLKQAKINNRDNLGDDIFIHGKKRSTGCIAIGDLAIEQLYPLVYEVGIENVVVVISPDDLRRYLPIYSHIKPIWLPNLYNKLREKLAEFPLASNV